MTEPRVLADAELVPGALWGRVMLHEITAWDGVISCWTYVTGGMFALGHPELTFTLLRDEGDPEDVVPTAPLQLFAMVHQRAAQGHRLRAGDVTELRDTRLFDHHILYVHAPLYLDVELPVDALAMLLVTSDELRAVREYGAMRVLARLGQASGFFPYPPWADRRRRALSLRDTFEASVLGKTPRAAIEQLSVVGKDEQIQLVAQRAARPLLQRLAQLPEDSAFALLTGLDPTVDSCLVWEPGQAKAAAIARPGSAGAKIAGCFVAFLPGQPADGGLLLEDGYAMQLTAASWQAVRQALIGGADLTIPATDGGKAFTLTWRDDPHALPVIGQAYDPEHGWGVSPQGEGAAGAGEGAAEAVPGKVTVSQGRLLTPEDDFGARSSPRDLAMFCREIQRVAGRVLTGHTGAFEATIQVRATPAGHQIQLAHRGAATPDVLARLHEAIRGLAKLPVREAEVVFELDLRVVP